MISIIALVGLAVIVWLEREPRTPEQREIDAMARRDRRAAR